MYNETELLEALGILQEECGETIVVASKVRRFGLDTEYIRGEGTKRTALTQEIGDILCLVDLLVENKVIDSNELDIAKKKKREKLKKFSNLPNLG